MKKELTLINCIPNNRDTIEQTQQKIDFLENEKVERQIFKRTPHHIIWMTKSEHLRECNKIVKELKFISTNKAKLQYQKKTLEKIHSITYY